MYTLITCLSVNVQYFFCMCFQFEHLAFYLIELCLVEYEALNYKPSMLCASAVYVARCTMKIAPVWTPLLTKHTRYNESEIRFVFIGLPVRYFSDIRLHLSYWLTTFESRRGCAEMIMKFHKAAKTSQLNVTYDKYMKQGRNRVANLPPLNRIPAWCAAVIHLAKVRHPKMEVFLQAHLIG